MDTDVYKSEVMPNAFLFVRAGSDPYKLPKPVLRKLGNLVFFKSISLIPDSPLIAADPDEVINNIEKNAYHLQGAKVRSDISTAGAAIGVGTVAVSLGGGPIGALIGAGIGLYLANKAKEKDDASLS